MSLPLSGSQAISLVLVLLNKPIWLAVPAAAPLVIKPYCSKEEHHQFVYNKFEKKFKEEFKELITKFKIKVNEFTYGIDYNTKEEEC